LASRRIRRNKSLAAYTAATYQDLIDLKSRSNPRSIAGSAIDGTALAEEIELVNKSLQSSNYLAGVDGWKIDGSGNAEFGNVYVRGDINAYSGTIGYWNISNPAVERTFGDTTLFGTFLESFDHGFTDAGATIGTYVSLFKSYIDVPITITSISVTSDIVTITAPDHNFFIGDKIVVEFDDAAYAGYESNTYLTVTETTPDTFSYIKRVQNNGDGSSDLADIAASGMAQIYNEDIAGLYLRDYSKANFDYGFFSNKGIAYTSAEVLNLVHNPSFEYKVGGGSNTYSNAGWSATSGITQMTFSSGYSTARYASEFGASIAWTSSNRTDYLTATIDYDAGDDYKIFDSSTPLYLGLNVFPAPVLANVAVTAVSTSNATHLLVSTSTAHGMAIGDYAYLNFSAVGDTSEAEYAYDSTYEDYGPKVFEVIGTSGPSIFYVKNSLGTTETLTLSASPKVYPKVVSPAFKLSEIIFKFGSDVSTTLENVLDDTYKTTDWTSSASKELSLSATIAVENVINGVAIPPMKNGDSVSYVPIDPKKIEDYYISLDPAGHANANAFYILFPTWTYKKDLDGATTVNKLLNTSYVIDNVYLSKSSKFFYADSSSTSNSWYASGSGTSAPTQASLEAPRNWIDIDLDSQTAIFDYIDYIGLESSTYSQPLSIKPSISMAPSATDFIYTDYLASYSSLSSYNPTVDSNVLSLTAGKVSYSSGASLTTEKESYINISVDRARSGVELVAKSALLGGPGFSKVASLSAHVDKGNRGLVSIQADYIVAPIAKFITDEGDPSLNASYVANNTSNSTGGGTNHLAYTIQSATANTTSTTYVATATQCYAYFTTGPSGYAEVSVYGYLDNDNASGITYLSFDIAPADDLANPVVAASDNRAVINFGTPQGAASTFYLFTGLPNTRYKIKTMQRASAGTAVLYTRSVMVIPIT
jgi:hypothetical protein